MSQVVVVPVTPMLMMVVHYQTTMICWLGSKVNSARLIIPAIIISTVEDFV